MKPKSRKVSVKKGSETEQEQDFEPTVAVNGSTTCGRLKRHAFRQTIVVLALLYYGYVSSLLGLQIDLSPQTLELDNFVHSFHMRNASDMTARVQIGTHFQSSHVLNQSNIFALERAVLTVAYVKAGTCPGQCMETFQTLLRDNIPYRFMEMNRTGYLPTCSHILLVARSEHLQFFTSQVVRLRQDGFRNFGLYLQADELNLKGGAEFYGYFDYVLRNYYFENITGGSSRMNLNALGNITCGKAPPLPEFGSKTPVYEPNGIPWLGVHWVMLSSRDNLTRLTVNSALAASDRPINCSFLGSFRAHREEMSLVLNKTCQIKRFPHFRGELNSYEYGSYVAKSKITLSPWGNNRETIRTADALMLGSIPLVITDGNDYIHKHFSVPPVLKAANWDVAATMLQEVLQWPDKLLNQRQRQNIEWYEKALSCQKFDFAKIYNLSANLAAGMNNTVTRKSPHK